VVVVGLPYPNITDVELQERMKYIDAQAAAAAGATTTTAQAASTAAAAATLLQPTQDVTAQHDQQQQQQAEAAAPEAPSVPRSAFRIINQAAPPAGTQGSGRSGPDKPAQQQQEAAATAAAAAASGSEAAGASAAAGPPAQVPSSSGRVLHALTGRDYYEDLAFKAVNQCVGRVVRHKGDHAAVVLLDVRWVVAPAEWAAAGERVRTGGRKLPVQKLPGWLQRSFVPTDGGFGPALKQLAAFFKRQQQPG
jgi:chromosome transmission fidelity protein 1